MSTHIKLETKGFEEYLEKIAKAGKDIDTVARRALEEGGNILVDGMKMRVPKDTRNLENHITIEGPFTNANYHWVRVGLSKNTDADTIRYGNVQEYGSAHTPAHPYVRPTLDNDMKKARARMREIFNEELL